MNKNFLIAMFALVTSSLLMSAIEIHNNSGYAIIVRFTNRAGEVVEETIPSSIPGRISEKNSISFSHDVRNVSFWTSGSWISRAHSLDSYIDQVRNQAKDKKVVLMIESAGTGWKIKSL